MIHNIHQEFWLHHRKVRVAVEVFATLRTAGLSGYLILQSQR
jgi:hypothetical protein